MQGISVIICCYNSAGRLPETLKWIAGQRGLEKVPWEVVVVNNNSTDDTVEVAKQAWGSYSSNVPITIVDESRAGLTFARVKGVLSSNYDYILFCDDDNWLEHDYVAKTFKWLNSHPKLGAIGGRSYAVFEDAEPEWFGRYQKFFAVGPQVESTEVPVQTNLLYGAGLGIRKSCIQKILNSNYRQLSTDRKGSSLSSGGDTELCYLIKLLGFDLVYDPSMKFRHFMPEGRLTDTYLKALVKGIERSGLALRSYSYLELKRAHRIYPFLWLYDTFRITYECILKLQKTSTHRRSIIEQQFIKFKGVIKLNFKLDANFKRIQAFLNEVNGKKDLCN